MVLSELSLDFVKKYLRVSDDEEDEVIAAFIPAAQSAVLTETGLSAQEADELPDIPVAALAIIGDMFVNREMTAAQAVRNPTADSILRLHRKVMVL